MAEASLPTAEDQVALRRQARHRSFLLPGAGFGLLGYPGWASFGFVVLWLLVVNVCLFSLFPNPLTWCLFVWSTIFGIGYWAVEYYAVPRLPFREFRRENLSTRYFGTVTIVSYIALAAAAAIAGIKISM